MNFKNVKAERTTETRNTHKIETLGTGNLYETIVLLSQRSNQLSQDLKKELAEKMEEFVIPNDTLEEVFENREQIEISKFYERLAKQIIVFPNTCPGTFFKATRHNASLQTFNKLKNKLVR